MSPLQVKAVEVADVSSSSSSSSSDEDDSASDSSPSPPPHGHAHVHAPPPTHPYPTYLPRPQTPSSVDEEEEEGTPLTPESSVSTGSGLKLTISKALLPPATVQHLGAEDKPGRSMLHR